jgi:phosphoesterase RecJ-like protein
MNTVHNSVITTQKLQAVHDLVRQKQSFAIISHIHSDGDALGSCFALSLHLKRLNKEVRVLIPGKIPTKYAFLDVTANLDRIDDKQAEQYIARCDIIFILDISAPDRMDIYQNAVLGSSAQKVWIDHHPLRCPQDGICLVDTQRIATAEILYRYFKQFQIAIDQEMAVALYTAIVSDSGGFRFQGVSSFTFSMAAELTALGVDPSVIYRRLFETSYHHQIRAWGEILQGMRQQENISYAIVTRELMQRYQIGPDELDGLIDFMRKDGGSEVFMVFVEKEAQQTQVGLRSRNGYNVGRIAENLGGGGHFHAAGFTIAAGVNAAVQRTISEVNAVHNKQQGKQ